RSACSGRRACAPRTTGRRAPRHPKTVPGYDPASASPDRRPARPSPLAGTPGQRPSSVVTSAKTPMPARNIATATISFGLVSVPVQIFSSSESKASVSFNMLHKKCGSKVKQQYICEKDNDEVVPRDEMVKGYEF